MPRTLARAALALALLAASAGAQAITCYVVFDRNENIVYRETYPPVDMSDRGAAARDALRQRGQFLMFVDLDQCPSITFVTGTAGTVGVDLTATMLPTALPTTASPAGPPAATRSTTKR